MRLQRRINQTARKRITKNRIAIRLIEPTGGEVPSFSATISLDDLDLPAHGCVFLEAYHKTSFQRFAWGTVGEPHEPEHKVLDRVDLDGRLLFRVKVVDMSEKRGRLLATADRIVPADEGDEPGRDHLVTVKTRDLGQLPWRMDLQSDPEVLPALLLNSAIPDAINRIRHDALFQALVLPPVVREVFEFIFSDPELGMDSDDLRGWPLLWTTWATVLSGQAVPRARDGYEYRQWLDDLLEEFSARFSLNERLVNLLVGVEA